MWGQKTLTASVCNVIKQFNIIVTSFKKINKRLTINVPLR